MILCRIYCCITYHSKTYWLKTTIYYFSQFCGLTILSQTALDWGLSYACGQMAHRAIYLPCAERSKWLTHRTGSWCWLLAGSSAETATRAPIHGCWVLKEASQSQYSKSQEEETAKPMKDYIQNQLSINSITFYWLEQSQDLPRLKGIKTQTLPFNGEVARIACEMERLLKLSLKNAVCPSDLQRKMNYEIKKYKFSDLHIV